MYIRGLIPRIFTELAKAVPIALLDVDKFKKIFARKLSCLTKCRILFGLQHLDSKICVTREERYDQEMLQSQKTVQSMTQGGRDT